MAEGESTGQRHRAAGVRGGKSSGLRWRGKGARVLDRFARAIARGRYPSVVAAVPDCWRELVAEGAARGRTRSAVAARLLSQAYVFGLALRRHVWLAEELRIVDRHARAIVRGKYANAAAAVPDCREALAKAGLPLCHPISQVGSKLRRRAHALGRGPCVVHWDPKEDSIVNRFARALADGEYPSAKPATNDCRKALAEAGLTRGRRENAVELRLLVRSRTYGRAPSYTRWTSGEAKVAERFVQGLVKGEYPSMAAAVAGCRRALKQAGFETGRTALAVKGRLTDRSQVLGWIAVDIHFSPREKQVIGHFATAIFRGKYKTATAAADDCLRSLRRVRPSVHRSSERVAGKLRAGVRALGRKQTRHPWSRQEDRLVARFAKSVADGRYPGAPQAAVDCKAALDRLRHMHQGRQRPLPVRSVERVTGRLWAGLARLGMPRAHGLWTGAELRVIDRYAHAVIRHRYPTLAGAVPDCWKAVNRLDSAVRERRSGRHDKLTVRSQGTVHSQLFFRAREIAHNQIPMRRWTADEDRLLTKWTRKYDLHRRDKLRMDIKTIAGMLQAELGRRGYYRSLCACLSRVYEGRRRLRRRPGRKA